MQAKSNNKHSNTRKALLTLTVLRMRIWVGKKAISQRQFKRGSWSIHLKNKDCHRKPQILLLIT